MVICNGSLTLTCFLRRKLPFSIISRANNSLNYVNLNYVEYTPKTKICEPLIIIHGLFGSQKNWQSISKALCQKQIPVVAVDLRNHGDSPRTLDMSLEDMASDLENLMKHLGLQKGNILGHSLGGKVAMTLALTKPHLVSKLIVEDIFPVNYPMNRMDFISKVIEKLQYFQTDDNLGLYEQRKIVKQLLSEIFVDPVIPDFIVSNLAKNDGHFHWKFNIHAIAQSVTDISSFPSLQQTYDKRTLFITGENSSYKNILLADVLKFFPNMQLQNIRNAGHWVHYENPGNFIACLKQFLLDDLDRMNSSN